ncbi:hypothetical protein KY289_023071 [Solanum tuberosum]|nr:hypothetical protein KY289_023071 [Solanum tuberosum]
MASPSNLNLALIPFENPENLFELPVGMFIDPCGITHLAYPLIEEASIHGERRNQSLGSDLGDETIARSEGEQISSKEQAHSSYDDDDDISLVQLVSKRLLSRLNAHESLTSNPLVKAPVRVTRFVQRTRDAILLGKSTKKTRLVQSKFVLPSNPIEIDDDDIIGPKKSRKQKRNTSKPEESGPKEIDEIDSARALSFRRRSVIRGTLRRRMGREKTREFYLIATGSATSISSTVCGVSFTLNAEILSSILGVPNSGWGHFVKRNWPPLEGNISALEICHRFSNDPTLNEYTRVDKGVRGLAYGFWLGMVFKHFGVPVGEWQIQTINDVLGVVDHKTIPATKRGANAPMQRLRASLTVKNEEIIVLQGSHSAAIDKLHIDYGLKHAILAEENSRLKEELAQTQVALNTERLSNSDRLKHLYELLTKDFPSSSSTLPPSV